METQNEKRFTENLKVKKEGVFLWELICQRLAYDETKQMRGDEAVASGQEARIPREAAFNVAHAAFDCTFSTFQNNLTKRGNTS